MRFLELISNNVKNKSSLNFDSINIYKMRHCYSVITGVWEYILSVKWKLKQSVKASAFLMCLVLYRMLNRTQLQAVGFNLKLSNNEHETTFRSFVWLRSANHKFLRDNHLGLKMQPTHCISNAGLKSHNVELFCFNQSTNKKSLK